MEKQTDKNTDRQTDIQVYRNLPMFSPLPPSPSVCINNFIIFHLLSAGIYASRFAAGNAEWNKRWSDFKVTANIHDDFAMELYNHLQVSDQFVDFK